VNGEARETLSSKAEKDLKEALQKVLQDDFLEL
jgi:hypothetical protein